jgi:hypothetical protein
VKLMRLRNITGADHATATTAAPQHCKMTFVTLCCLLHLFQECFSRLLGFQFFCRLSDQRAENLERSWDIIARATRLLQFS